MNEQKGDEYITVKEATFLCGVSCDTICNWIKNGKLEGKQKFKGSKIEVSKKSIKIISNRKYGENKNETKS